MAGAEQTSSALLALVVQALRRRHAELLPEGLRAPDAVRQSKVTADSKTRLLEHVYAEGGPEILVDLLSGLSEVGFVPMLSVLLAAPTPQALLHRWLRLERYGHSRHRLRLTAERDRDVELERYALRGPPPSRVDDLLILGLIVNLLAAVGAQGVAAWLGDVEVVRDARAVPGAISQPTPTDRWRIRWRGIGPRPGAPTGASSDPVALQRSAPTSPLVDRAVQRMAEDLLEPWTVASLAHALGVSRRTLQRRFTEAELSFSQAVRALRVKAACGLLAKPGLSLTEIGFSCGFADSAHFARDFKRSTGASPSEYRAEMA